MERAAGQTVGLPVRALTDCHAHLADPLFDADRAAVLERAREAGVEAVITVCETLAEACRVLELAERHAEMLACAGLYPTQLDPAAAEATERWIREHRDRLVGIGEVGLDHWIVREPAARELQREIFAGFVRLALELDLPLNVHSRSAGRETVALLLGLGARRVQLHAFDAKPSTALPAVEAGYFFSIPASVLYSKQKRKLVRKLPLSSLLVETDSPVMAPQRGARNEPANLPLVISAVAELQNRPPAEVREAVIANTRRLYSPAAT